MTVWDTRIILISHESMKPITRLRVTSQRMPIPCAIEPGQRSMDLKAPS